MVADLKCAISTCGAPAQYVSYGTSLCRRCLMAMDDLRREALVTRKPASVSDQFVDVERLKSMVEQLLDRDPEWGAEWGARHG